MSSNRKQRSYKQMTRPKCKVCMKHKREMIALPTAEYMCRDCLRKVE